MQKHAADVVCILKDAGVDRAAFVGISIGGYILFEFWRCSRDRVSALVLSNTKAQADTPEAKAARLKAAADVVERGVEPFFESLVPRLIGQTTRSTRPDRVEGALRMMRKMSPEDVAQVQHGHGRAARFGLYPQDDKRSHTSPDWGRGCVDRATGGGIDGAQYSRQ